VLFDGSGSQEVPTGEEDEFEETKPLGEELIDTLVDLLFFSEFTLPKTTNGNKVSFAIWQSGVGCNSPVGTSKEYENNRMEILRLLLTLSSKSMYTPASKLQLFHVGFNTHRCRYPARARNQGYYLSGHNRG